MKLPWWMTGPRADGYELGDSWLMGRRWRLRWARNHPVRVLDLTAVDLGRALPAPPQTVARNMMRYGQIRAQKRMEGV